MTTIPEAVPPPATAVPLSLIQSEYLEDLKCRASSFHYKKLRNSCHRFRR